MVKSSTPWQLPIDSHQQGGSIWSHADVCWYTYGFVSQKASTCYFNCYKKGVTALFAVPGALMRTQVVASKNVEINWGEDYDSLEILFANLSGLRAKQDLVAHFWSSMSGCRLLKCKNEMFTVSWQQSNVDCWKYELNSNILRLHI